MFFLNRKGKIGKMMPCSMKFFENMPKHGENYPKCELSFCR